VARIIVLDSGPLGDACRRRGSPEVEKLTGWWIQAKANGAILAIPESRQTECGFQAIVDLLHRGCRKATDHLVNARQFDCDQVIARYERVVQQTGLLALDSGRLDQQVGWLARSCQVRRDLGQDRGRHPRIVGIVLHDETRASLAARSGGKRVERQHDIATVHGRCFSYSS
jgi:hypothetical protein